MADRCRRLQADAAAEARRLTEGYRAHLQQGEQQAKQQQADACAKREGDYAAACSAMESAKTSADYRAAGELFNSLYGYSDSNKKRLECRQIAHRQPESRRHRCSNRVHRELL